MLHIVNSSVGFAHLEMFINHVEQLSSGNAESLCFDGLQLLELNLSREITGDNSRDGGRQFGIEGSVQSGWPGKRHVAFSKINKCNAGLSDMTDPSKRGIRVGGSCNDFFNKHKPPCSVVSRLRPWGKGDFLSLLGRSSIIVPGTGHRGVNVEVLGWFGSTLGCGWGSPPATY